MSVIISNPIAKSARPAFQAGFREVDGTDLNNAILSDVISSADGLTALAGGGQTNATMLPGPLNRVAVVATAGDSVQLPRATGGNQVAVINAGAATMQVFGAVGSADTINGTAGSTGVAQNNTTQAFSFYFSPSPGTWFRIVNAIA